MQMLTGAVMLTAVLSTGPTSAAAALPPVTAAPATSITQVAHAAAHPSLQLESTLIPAGQTAEPIYAEQPAIPALTQISVLTGRLSAAAPGERAPPRR